MSTRTTYYVRPSEYGWEGMMEGAVRASVSGKTKQETLDKTIALAREREPSSVIVLNSENEFQEERTYGIDPTYHDLS